MKSKNISRLFLAALLVIFTLLFLFSAVMFFREFIPLQQDKIKNEQRGEPVRDLQQNLDRDKENPSKLPEEPDDGKAAAEAALLEHYRSLWEENNDMAGWVYIEDTPVNYPVMWTPDLPDKYLRRAFDGSYSISGTPFLGEGWTPESNYALILGHHMKNGQMFGTLSKYADPEYAAEHPIICFDTVDKLEEYTFVAAFYSQIYPEGVENVFRYYAYTDLSDPEVFDSYVSQVKATALYDTGVDIVYGDKILALSTCNYHTDNGRFVVIARRAADDHDISAEDVGGENDPSGGA